MISIEQLKDLYEAKFKQSLLGLEKQRKVILWLFRIMIAFYVCTGLTFISIFILFDKIEDSIVFTLFVLMFGFTIIGIIFNLGIIKKRKEKYRSAYKRKVVERIIEMIEPAWDYQSDGHIGALEFKSSKLFSRPYSIYEGDDLVIGKIDKTDFKSSELNVKYEVGAGDSKEYLTLFSGFFFHADFNKNFSGETYLVHGTLEEKAQSLRSVSYGKSGSAKCDRFVKLENPEFAKIFTVSSTNQQEARYILTPKIMEVLVNLHKKYPYPTHISFVGNRVYFAISFGKELFEPKIFKPVAIFDEVEKLFNLFMLNATIINELNLNTRIWTKE